MYSPETIKLEQFNIFMKDLERIPGTEGNIMIEPLLHLISKAFHYQTVTLSEYGREGFRGTIGIGRFENARENYLTFFQKRDPYAHNIRKAYESNPGLVTLNSSAVFGNSENEYHRWIRNYGVRWALSMPIGDYTLSVYKHEGEADFSCHEQEGLKLLSAILRGKYNAQQKLNSQSVSSSIQSVLLDSAGIGAVCLDKNMQVISYNKNAASFLRRAFNACDIQTGCEHLLKLMMQNGKKSTEVFSSLMLEYMQHSVTLEALDGQTRKDRHYAITIRPLAQGCLDAPQDILMQYGLTEREWEVACMILRGKSYQETADALYISINTVRAHIRNLYKKTGISNQRMLANFFKDAGNSPAH